MPKRLSKLHKHSSSTLKSISRLHRVAVFCLAFGIIGILYVLISQAAVPTISLDAEQGVTTANACKINDVTASASSSIRFSNTSCSSTPDLPAGVTLRQIDGGSDYYCRSGFANACSTSFNGMSWDDPRFFPIGQDYSFTNGTDTNIYKELGLNYVHRITSPMDLAILKNAGIWVIPSPGEYKKPVDGGTNPGPETVGWHIEEPQGWQDIRDQVASISLNDITNRFLHISLTWNQLYYGGYSGTPGDGSMDAMMSAPISSAKGTVHLDVGGDDIYWFAGDTTDNNRYSGGKLYNTPPDENIYENVVAGATPDRMARGSNYGDMIDLMRDWVKTYPAPVPGMYIESEDGLVGNGRRIKPGELNWAVWSQIVHGARWIQYFSATSNYGTGATFGFDKNKLAGQTISVFDQAKLTNNLVKNVAPIINAPFTLNYVSVTPKGYSFPIPHVVWDNGIDIMAKYYTGGNFSNVAGNFTNGFYIFATVRGSGSQTNINATYTVAGNYSGPITVINENRTIQATNGVFTDTFANAYTAHIYKVN